MTAAEQIYYDKQDQVEKVQAALLQGERIIAVYDGKGGGSQSLAGEALTQERQVKRDRRRAEPFDRVLYDALDRLARKHAVVLGGESDSNDAQAPLQRAVRERHVAG